MSDEINNLSDDATLTKASPQELELYKQRHIERSKQAKQQKDARFIM